MVYYNNYRGVHARQKIKVNNENFRILESILLLMRKNSFFDRKETPFYSFQKNK